MRSQLLDLFELIVFLHSLVFLELFKFTSFAKNLLVVLM